MKCILCLLSMPPPQIPTFPGQESFAGLQHHSSQHTGNEEVAGKKVVVLGSNNSAHDIAAAVWEAGGEVSIGL